MGTSCSVGTRIGKGLKFSMKQESFMFIFRKDHLLLKENPSSSFFSVAESTQLALPYIRQGSVGSPKGEGHFWGEVSEDTYPPAGAKFVSLRSLYDLLGERGFNVAGQAYQIMNWRRTTQFCASCGSVLREHVIDRALECPVCHTITYPPVTPVIAVAIEKDGHLLLARSPHFPPNRYSILAGFVEPGEQLEEAVAREVKEEVGLEIQDITYFGSQPWPFPHTLMVGFTASWKAGNIQIDEKEIEAADWYSPYSMPEIPPRASISRRLIDNYLEHTRD
ncbi:MAG TPA: NAD(+) diphosphatase [Aminobacterium sp.]|nr:MULTISPECIES: NAD(+) diphosphatase [unclassified Aminobacterium]HCA41216.1 NAD(+) diphosphatase [Aminobacterium sp.]